VAAREKIEELEETENSGLALFLRKRLADSEGRRPSADEFLMGIDMGGS
jgi:hypothetical protein